MNMILPASILISCIACFAYNSDRKNNDVKNIQHIDKSTSEDSVFISTQKTDSSEIYILHHITNNVLQKVYKINTEDGSSIDYEYRYRDNGFDYDCISLWNNAGGCNQYIFLNRRTNVFYITKHCFVGFHIEKQSVNFEDKTLILFSDENIEDITDLSFSEDFILYGYPIGKRVLERITVLPIKGQ